MRKIIVLGVCVIFIIQLGYRIYGYRASYSTRFDPNYWTKRYNDSQWTPKSSCIVTDPHINPHTCVWDDNWYDTHKATFKSNATVPIGDDGLYTYAGYQYIKGHDPTTLNAEIPPLGKYAIGLSIVLFHNQNIFALFAGLLALGSLFLLNTQIFKNKFLAFIPVVLFSLEPLFYTQLRAPFLDTFYLSFLLLTFFFFLRKNYVLGGIFLGCMMSVKASSSTFILVILVALIYLFLTRAFREMRKLLLLVLSSAIVFIAAYLRYFLLGHSVREFIGVQTWIVHFYANGAHPNPVNALQMLLLGRWTTWWGPTSHIPEWSLSWSVLLVVFCVYLLYAIKTRYKGKTLLLALWILLYLGLFVVVPVWPRYLLLVLPFLYNLTVWLFSRSIGSRFWQSRLPSSIS